MDKKEEVVAPCKGEKGLSSYYLNEEWKNYSLREQKYDAIFKNIFLIKKNNNFKFCALFFTWLEKSWKKSIYLSIYLSIYRSIDR